MQLGLVVAASLLVVFAILVFAALRIEFDARGQGAPDGGWVVAGALGFGPCTFSVLSRRGAPTKLELHFAGRRWPLPLGARKPRPRPAPAADTAQKPAEKSRLRVFDLGPLELAELALSEGRYISWDRLLLDVAYGFQDVALTGRVAGALYALGGALPPKFVIRQRPIWESSDRWEASVEGALRIWPGLVLFSVLWYMLRRKAARFGPARRASTELATHVQS